MSARAILFGKLLVFVSLSKVFTLGEYDYPYKDKLDYDVPESVSHNISHPLWNQPIEETHITSTNVPNILTIDNSLAQVVQRVESTPNPNDLAKMWMRDYINKTHMKLDKERTKPNKQTPGHDYGPNINRQGPRAYATNPHMNAQMPAMYLNENGPNWDRPRTNMDNPGSVMLSPIANSNNPGPYMHRPYYGTDTVKNIPGPYMNSPRPNVNRPGQNMNRPVQTMNGPWQNVNGPGLNMNRPGQSMNRPNMYGKMNAAGQYMNSQGQYMNRQQANPNQGYSYQWQGWGNMSPQSPYKVQPSLFPAQSYYGKYPPVGVWNQGVNYYNSLDANKYVRQNQGVPQNNAPNKVINPQDQLENLQNPVTDSQNFAENPSQYVTNSQNQMENAQNQVTNSQNQMENAQNQVTNSQNQVENAQNQVTNSQNQMKNAQNQVTNSQNQMDHLQNQVTNPNQVTNSQNFEVNPSHQATNSQNQVENSQSQVTNTNQVTTNPKNQQNQVETQVPPTQEMNANKQPVNESNINMQMDVNIQNQNVSKQEPTQNEVPNQPTQQPKPSQISNMEADIYDSIPGWYSVIPANEEEGASATFGSVPGLITEGDVGTEPDVAEHHADDALADLAVPTKLELYQPDEFVKEVEKFRLEHQLGYFSAFSIYLCEISSNMDSTDLREIFVGLKEVIDEKTKSGAFKHLGYPAGMMLPNAVQIMLSWDTDRLKSEILKGAELIRVKSLSPEVQNIYTQIDSLYTMTEGAELIKALYLVKVYPDKKQTTTFIARSLIQAILAPFTRLQGTPVQTKLMTDINTQLTKRLMARKSWEAVTNKRFKTTKSMHTITKERKKNDPSSKNKHSNGRHIRNDNNNADDNFQRESKQTYYTFTTERINKDDILETKQKYTLNDKRKKKDKYFDMKQIGTNIKERYEKVDDSFQNKPKKGRSWKRKDIRDENYFQSKQETVKDNSLELWNSNIQETSVQSDVNDYTKESDESKKADNFHYNNKRDELDNEGDTFTKETKAIKEVKTFLINIKDYDIKTSTKTTDFVNFNIDFFQEDPDDSIAEEQKESLKVKSYFRKVKGDEEAHSKKSRSDNIFRNRENTSYYKINARNLKDTKIYKNTKPIKNRLKRNNNLKRKINKKEITIDKDRSNKRKGIFYKLNFDNDEHFKENIEKQETDKSWTNTDEQILMEKLMEASRVKVIQNAQNQKTRSLKKKRNDVDKNSGIERRMNTLAIKRNNFEDVHENTLKNKILHIISDMENIVNILNSMESR